MCRLRLTLAQALIAVLQPSMSDCSHQSPSEAGEASTPPVRGFTSYQLEQPRSKKVDDTEEHTKDEWLASGGHAGELCSRRSTRPVRSSLQLQYLAHAFGKASPHCYLRLRH